MGSAHEITLIKMIYLLLVLRRIMNHVPTILLFLLWAVLSLYFSFEELLPWTIAYHKKNKGK